MSDWTETLQAVAAVLSAIAWQQGMATR